MGWRILFGGTLLLAAALLFWIQLLVSKLLLPILGGSSAVWNTCLVYFQTALLIGYLYAFLSSRLWTGRHQPFLHPALLLLGAAVLPITVAGVGAPPVDTTPIPWLLLTLSLMVGLPFTVLAGTAPLLQAWYSRARLPSSDDPYFLYAASNLGSFGVLLAYPTVIEPGLTLTDQSRLWAVCYGLLILLVAVCGFAVRRAEPAAALPEPQAAAPETAATPGIWRRLHWVLLAFVPSSLLLGVTTHLTTDVAAAPLFWVVPLALYLLSYVLAFQRVMPLPISIARTLQPLLMIPLAMLFLCQADAQPLPLFALHLTAFFVTALLCHQELARLRPNAARLTEFYLLLSLGGALGGIFNALLAPILFDRIAEYPLVLILACLLRPGVWMKGGTRGEAIADVVFPGMLALALFLLARKAGVDFTSTEEATTIIVLLAAALVVVDFQNRPLRFGLGVAALMAVGVLLAGTDDVLLRVRNFYGELTVVTQEDPDLHILFHGTTTHGSQSQDPDHRLDPLSYYHNEGPVGHLFADLHKRGALDRVGIVGLGTGTLACYAKPGERWSFFEINAAVVSIARDPALFTFLKDCPAKPDIVLGDARLSLERAAPGSFDMILLDAFDSDAVPVHLLTREALTLYLGKLKPRGVLVFHISNRFLDLAPVLGAVVGDLGLKAKRWNDDDDDTGPDDDPRPDPKDASDWVVIARNDSVLSALGEADWHPLPSISGVRTWTDDYSNVLGAMSHAE